MPHTLLRVDEVSQRFGGVLAVDRVSLELDEGAIRCIIGPNGAGKSTLFNMLAGTLKPLSGHIYVDGRDVVALAQHKFARIGIVRKFQVPSVFESLTVSDNLDVAARKTKKLLSNEFVESVVSATGLMERRDVPASVLSHGEKQWLEICMGLIAAPRLFLLDEPTAGMTGEETQKTVEILLNLKGQLTVIVIEHDMRFVRELGEPVTVMHQGRILREGSFAEIEQDETVRDIYLGKTS